MDLIDIADQHKRSHMTWQPPTPPDLSNEKILFFDTETDTLEWWDRDIFLGVAIRTLDGRSWYLPCRHQGGGNLSEEQVRRFLQQELRGKYLIAANAKFDIHVLRGFGVDLEAQGNTIGDVQQWAALLDNDRRKFNLNSLALDYLGLQKKEIDAKRMKIYHAGEVDEYARYDVELNHKLYDVFWPLLDKEDLQRVRALEDRTIFPVCEMEKNACPLDVELLEKWNVECEQEYLKLIWKIHKETGVKVNPKSADTVENLLDELGVEPAEYTETGKVVTAVKSLKSYDHPVVQKVVRAAQLRSLHSKYIASYLKVLTKDGRLRFNLHQTRESTDSEGSKGTGFGRFSSSDKNIQQVFNAARQKEKLGSDDYIIRKLFIPLEGRWLSADAMQIEFRLVSHYAKPPEVLEAYKNDPLVSFHKVVWDIVREITDISYKALKDLNFAKVYGAGYKKCTVMMGLPQTREGFALGKKFSRIWDNRFPEMKNLATLAINVAKRRGWVKTILGRRARYGVSKKYHAALNNIVQGSAGDLMKIKLCELHEARKETGFKMRVTVHDEVCGDTPDEECTQRVKEILNQQSIETVVPILWDVKTGKNWAEA